MPAVFVSFHQGADIRSVNRLILTVMVHLLDQGLLNSIVLSDGLVDGVALGQGAGLHIGSASVGLSGGAPGDAATTVQATMPHGTEEGGAGGPCCVGLGDDIADHGVEAIVKRNAAELELPAAGGMA